MVERHIFFCALGQLLTFAVNMVLGWTTITTLVLALQAGRPERRRRLRAARVRVAAWCFPESGTDFFKRLKKEQEEENGGREAACCGYILGRCR